MSDEDLLELLQQPIAFHRPLARAAGSATAGLFLSQLVYWTKRASHDDGWVYKKSAEWQLETALTEDEQRGARRALLARGLIEEKEAWREFKGFNKFDKTKCYRIAFNQLKKCLCTENSPETRVVVEGGKFPTREDETPSPKGANSQPEGRKLPVHRTKTTSTTSSKTTTTTPRGREGDGGRGDAEDRGGGVFEGLENKTPPAVAAAGGARGEAENSLDVILPDQLNDFKPAIITACHQHGRHEWAQALADEFAARVARAAAGEVAAVANVKAWAAGVLKRWAEAGDPQLSPTAGAIARGRSNAAALQTQKASTDAKAGAAAPADEIMERYNRLVDDERAVVHANFIDYADANARHIAKAFRIHGLGDCMAAGEFRRWFSLQP